MSWADIEETREGAMELILSDDDARTLRDLLSDHLHDLRLEVARTEAKDFRHVMLMRQELVERLLAQLGDQPAV
jgi:hypothetical protein